MKSTNQTQQMLAQNDIYEQRLNFSFKMNTEALCKQYLRFIIGKAHLRTTNPKDKTIRNRLAAVIATIKFLRGIK